MKIVLCLVPLLLWATNADAATLVYRTGFEGPVDIRTPRTARATFFKDCGSTTCVNPNVVNCTIGCNDSVTGYNVPAGFPGKFAAEGDIDSQVNINHTVTVDESEVEIVTASGIGGPVEGAECLRMYMTSDTQGNRCQLNMYSTYLGENKDDHDESATVYWTYWDWSDWGERSTNTMAEYRGVDNKLVAFAGGFHYIVAGTNFSNSFDHAQNNAVLFPLQQWVEVLIYQNIGEAGAGRFIFKYRTVGGPIVTVFDWTGKNNVEFDAQDLNSREVDHVRTWNPIKLYGIREVWAYYDDFRVYETAGPSDLPPFGDDAAPSPPRNLVIR